MEAILDGLAFIAMLVQIILLIIVAGIILDLKNKNEKDN